MTHVMVWFVLIWVATFYNASIRWDSNVPMVMYRWRCTLRWANVHAPDNDAIGWDGWQYTPKKMVSIDELNDQIKQKKTHTNKNQ